MNSQIYKNRKSNLTCNNHLKKVNSLVAKILATHFRVEFGLDAA